MARMPMKQSANVPMASATRAREGISGMRVLGTVWMEALPAGGESIPARRAPRQGSRRPAAIGPGG
jgi:hypothetical protein